MRIGIVGGGQLGRMLALAAYPLGLEPVVYDPDPSAAAGQVARLVTGAFDDPESLGHFARGVERLTYEFENIDAPLLKTLAEQGVPFDPSPKFLAISQDRLYEKRALSALGIPVAPHRPVDSFAELERAYEELGGAIIVKTRRLGYDGRGQWRIEARAQLPQAWNALGTRPLVAEALVPFETEVSMVACRSRDGTMVFYPLTENRHERGILRLSRAPLQDPRLASLAPEAEQYVRRLAEHYGYIGILTVEFFVHEGRLVANETAPRVHNSGHWTIDGCVTSQFANHLRALAGYPLGTTQPRGHAAMVNCVGGLPDPRTVLALPGAQFHDYGKRIRPGRKVGHVTLIGASAYDPREEPLSSLLALAPFVLD